MKYFLKKYRSRVLNAIKTINELCEFMTITAPEQSQKHKLKVDASVAQMGYVFFLHLMMFPFTSQLEGHGKNIHLGIDVSSKS